MLLADNINQLTKSDFNNNYTDFIDGTIKTQYLEGDEHIFHKIKSLNNNVSIMPADEGIKKKNLMKIYLMKYSSQRVITVGLSKI